MNEEHNINNFQIMDRLWCPKCRLPYRSRASIFLSGHYSIMDKNDWSQHVCFLKFYCTRNKYYIHFSLLFFQFALVFVMQLCPGKKRRFILTNRFKPKARPKKFPVSHSLPRQFSQNLGKNTHTMMSFFFIKLT